MGIRDGRCNRAHLTDRERTISSLAFYVFRPLMRVVRRMQAHFPVQDADALVRFRQRADRLADLAMRPPRGVTVQREPVGGVAGDWLLPEGAPPDPVMLFLHGGGLIFTWGSPHRRLVSYLARFAGLRAFGVDYRLAPQHVYPAAHDDCFCVYQALAGQGRRVVLVGESSGGVLALATLLRARAAGLEQPLLCALISPTIDYGFRDTRIWASDDPFVAPEFAVGLHAHYVVGNDTTLPDLAPIGADLSGLPPLLVLVAEHDALRCETDRLAQAAERYGVELQLVVWPQMWHGWHVLAPVLPEGTQALRTLGETIRQRMIG
jgi:monoterpene epsilon-lactone hydrolase